MCRAFKLSLPLRSAPREDTLLLATDVLRTQLKRKTRFVAWYRECNIVLLIWAETRHGVNMLKIERRGWLRRPLIHVQNYAFRTMVRHGQCWQVC